MGNLWLIMGIKFNELIVSNALYDVDYNVFVVLILIVLSLDYLLISLKTVLIGCRGYSI